MSNKKSAITAVARRNPVAKHARTFNRASRQADRTKYNRKTMKHQGLRHDASFVSVPSLLAA